MAGSDPIDDIEEQAARWAARSADGTLPDADRAALEAWLAADRRHQGAYLRARAALYALEDAVAQDAARTPGNDNRPLSPAETRRFPSWLTRVAGGGAAIAACAAGLFYFTAPERPAPGSANAPQVMALTDGSTVTLGRGGKIAVALADDSRRITLQTGEATFQVAKDGKRPFIVQSGDVYAEATGTVYTVRRLGAAGGAVEVAEGGVLVWARDRRAQAVLLHAGERLALDPATLPPLPKPAKPAQVPTAGGPQFSFDNISIGDAVARFNRVNRTQIVVDDRLIADTPIVGLFDAKDPDGFAKAAAAVTGARVAHRQGMIVIEK